MLILNNFSIRYILDKTSDLSEVFVFMIILTSVCNYFYNFELLFENQR